MNSCLSPAYKWKAFLPSLPSLPSESTLCFEHPVEGARSNVLGRLWGLDEASRLGSPSESLGLCHVQNGNGGWECSISTVLEGFNKKDTVWWHKTVFAYFILLILGTTSNSQEALLNLNWSFNTKDPTDNVTTSHITCNTPPVYYPDVR